MDDTEYITLKEAALISGYAPDYIGQLIRRGKIPGKQVYANVAWVTTKEAISAYQNGKTQAESIPELDTQSTPQTASPTLSFSPTPSINTTLSFLDGFFLRPEMIERTHRIVSIVSLILASLFLVLLFAIFSIAVNDRLNARALEHATALSPTHAV